MINQAVEQQAKMYVYDLNNCARENGFKADEGWELSLATGEEKTALEKRYFPTISTKVLPEILLELFRVVKAKLIQAKSEAGGRVSNDMVYLVAYNPKRMR